MGYLMGNYNPDFTVIMIIIIMPVMHLQSNVTGVKGNCSSKCVITFPAQHCAHTKFVEFEIYSYITFSYH